MSLLCDEYLWFTLVKCSSHSDLIQNMSCIIAEYLVPLLLFSTFHSITVNNNKAQKVYKSQQVSLLLLMMILYWSLNSINYPGTLSLLPWLRGWHTPKTMLFAHHPSPTFVTHCVIRLQPATMATLKITPVNQSENIRWLSAAVCLPSTPPPPLSTACS